MVSSESEPHRKYGKSKWTKQNHHDTECLTTCLELGTGYTITLVIRLAERKERWECHEQALITTIRKDTDRTEESKEADTDDLDSITSTAADLTWTVLRALQQINCTTRTHEEEATSAPPSSSLRVSRREIRTNGSNMREPIQTRKGKLAGRSKHNARLACVVQAPKRGG